MWLYWRHETPVLGKPIKLIHVDEDIVLLDKPCSLLVSVLVGYTLASYYNSKPHGLCFCLFKCVRNDTFSYERRYSWHYATVWRSFHIIVILIFVILRLAYSLLKFWQVTFPISSYSLHLQPFHQNAVICCSTWRSFISQFHWICTLNNLIWQQSELYYWMKNVYFSLLFIVATLCCCLWLPTIQTAA